MYSSALVIVVLAAAGSIAERRDLCLAPKCVVGKPCSFMLPPCARMMPESRTVPDWYRLENNKFEGTPTEEGITDLGSLLTPGSCMVSVTVLSSFIESPENCDYGKSNETWLFYLETLDPNDGATNDTMVILTELELELDSEPSNEKDANMGPRPLQEMQVVDSEIRVLSWEIRQTEEPAAEQTYEPIPRLDDSHGLYEVPEDRGDSLDNTLLWLSIFRRTALMALVLAFIFGIARFRQNRIFVRNVSPPKYQEFV